MSNYPEGVSGSEYAIAGPRKEYVVEQYVTCANCAAEMDMEIDVQYDDGEEFGHWPCPVCYYENEYSHYPQFDWKEYERDA